MTTPPAGEAVPAPRAGVLRSAMRVAMYLLAALALLRLVVAFDVAAVRTTLEFVGPWALLVLVPLGLQIALEAASWRLLLEALDRPVRWLTAWCVNLRADAVRLSVPSGAPLADALRPVLFARRSGVPLSDGASALVVRKLSHLATHGVFLGLGAALGGSLLERWGHQLAVGGRALSLAGGAAASGLIGGALLVGLSLAYGSLVARTHGLLARLAGGRIAAFLAERRDGFDAFERRVQRLLRERPAALGWNLATGLAGWMLEALETLLIVRLLGFQLGIGEAIALEGLISAIRAAAFAVPGGLGIQDYSYHALLHGSMGDAATLSVILLKRARDVAWVATGYLLPLALDRIDARRAEAQLSSVDKA